ncbi:MAG: AraC family transcriptional regulator [Bacteroidota bacterium]
MILIPQILFDNPQVNVIFRDGNVCILQKELVAPVIKKEGYISNHVVSILMEGEQRIRTYEGELIKVEAGEVLFIPRGMYQITDLLPQGGHYRSLLFYFDDAVIQQFLSNSKVREVSRDDVPTFLRFGPVPSIHYFAHSFLEIYQPQKSKNKQLLHLKILELLHLLNDLASQQKFANFLFQLTLPKKRNIKVFMEQNFAKPLKIEDYAYLTGRSISTFRRDFKAYYEITPQKWLKEKRLDKALSILAERQISVTELAYEVGYENISYFIKAFKLKVGLSPKQYILAQRRNNLLN